MTEGHQNHDEHRVSVAAVENRIHADSLSTECPMKTGTINMENLMALPNITNHKKQRENYIDLCGKIACASIKSLEKFKDVAVHHIKHAYSAQARRGTDTKFVGMIYTNSNESAEMEEIMKEIHSKYVPCNNGKCSSLAIVGDQGTVERGVNVLLQLSNGFDEVEWLDGLHLKVGDFHAGMKFLQFGYDQFYNAKSVMDKCTIFSDRTLINRRNVVTDVSKRFDANKKFFLLEVHARIVAALLVILGIKDIEEQISEGILPKYICSKSKKERIFPWIMQQGCR
ncbi:uncharacterized protein LOC135683648 [Rhopilema esculentum]|uniref:uncharacterized protein LOC135683648 n=1 Tax=Rhopilema esculentum TaxID=499914 RepID=UPI0031DD98BE